MSFFVLTCLGIAAAIIHLLLPGEHRIGPASAVAVGVLGSWNGCLVAQAFVRGGWIAFGPLGFAGAVVGAVGSITLVELAAQAYLRREDATGRQA